MAELALFLRHDAVMQVSEFGILAAGRFRHNLASFTIRVFLVRWESNAAIILFTENYRECQVNLSIFVGPPFLKTPTGPN